MRPHHSQPSRENATPTSGASPLASYKEVRPPTPPPPPPRGGPEAEDISLGVSECLLLSNSIIRSDLRLY